MRNRKRMPFGESLVNHPQPTVLHGRKGILDLNLQFCTMVKGSAKIKVGTMVARGAEIKHDAEVECFSEA